MKPKSPKQQLNVMVNLQQEHKQSPVSKKQPITQKHPSHSPQQSRTSPLPSSPPPPKKRQQLKRVQEDIQTMKNKILLLKIQLQKQQQSIKLNKNKTEDIIRKKIIVNKVQQYKVKDNSADIQRAQRLRQRNASLRQSHQNEMQNILKAIYLVKLDDAREIKNLSKSHRQKIMQMNQIAYNQQLQKKNKVVQQSIKAKQRYEQYFREKLASIYNNEEKNRQELERIVNQRKDQLKQLRQQEIKLLQKVNKIQSQQLQTKKQYLAAVSLPVRDVADALKRSKSVMDNSTHSLNDQSSQNMYRMNSQMTRNQINDKINASSLSGSRLQGSMRDSLDPDPYKKPRIPNSKVNKEKLAIILKQLKRLQKKQKQQNHQSTMV